MWKPERVTLTITVEVNLDPIPGAFHTERSAKEAVQDICRHALAERIPHYEPIVEGMF
jgi:hypothetical protein